MQSHLNTFTNGLSKDQNPQLQQSTTYVDALNGRIVYNDNGTLSFQNAKGNTNVINLTNGYMPIGIGVVQDYAVIFSTDGTNSEIGFIREPSFGTWQYQVVFNDSKDPYSNKLNFSVKHQIKCSVEFENTNTINAYWDDFYNEPRSFNIMAGKDNGWWTSTSYPDWYNVWGMASMPDFMPDMVQYRKTIAGNKLSGKYQYCYRLITKNETYKTPYSTPCNLITLAAPDVSSTNWTTYNMATPTNTTNKGIEVVIDRVDARYDTIELVCIYWSTNLTKTAYVCATASIPKGQPFIDMTLQDTSSLGTSVDLAAITQEFTDIRKAKTNTIFRGHLLRGNVELGTKLTYDTTDIEVLPALRNMLSDTAGGNTSLPFTNQSPSGTDYCHPLLFVASNGSLISNQGLMDNEYYNYKGTQWENRFQSYWRGETYPFAIVLYDMKGQPMWANHIADVVMPKQYSDGSTNNQTETTIKKLSGTTTTTDYVDVSECLNNLAYATSSTTEDTFKLTQTDSGTHLWVTDNVQTTTGQDVVRPMGVILNNIDLTDYIYDDGGKQQISGFSIVRMPRYRNILFQGAMSQVLELNNNLNYTNLYNYFTSDTNYYNVAGSDNSGLYQNDAIGWQPNLGVVTSPELDFAGNAFPTYNSNCRLEIQGAVYASGSSDTIYNHPGVQLQWYNKLYKTSRVGDNSSRVGNFYNPTTYSSFPVTLYGAQGVASPPAVSGSILGVQNWIGNVGGHDYNYALSPYQCVMSGNMNPYFYLKGGGQVPTLANVNYTLGINTPAITETELGNRVYNNIGHFIPLTPGIIALCTNGSNRVIFNGVEVFGGDAYVDIFSTCRLLPYDNAAHDYNFATGVMFPCESAYNFSMQYNQGASVPNGSEYAQIGSLNGSMVNGVGIYVSGGSEAYHLEPFSLYSVMQAEDNWYTLKPKPQGFVEKNKQTTTIYYSNEKILGETTDSFRIFNVLNYGAVNGSLGEINRIEKHPVFNEIYVMQTSAISRARFKERTMVSSSIGELYTGTGIGLDGFDYISTEIGLQQQFAFCNSPTAFYGIDSYKGLFWKFSQAGLDYPAISSGLHNYFTEKTKGYWNIPESDKFSGVYYPVTQYSTEEYSYIDNACGIDKATNPTGAGGINLAFDYKNNSVIISFSDVVYTLDISGTLQDVKKATKATLEYNETINKFVGYFDAYPNLMIPFSKRGLLMNYSCMNDGTFSNSDLYLWDEGLRGRFFETDKETKLKFAINPNLSLTKYFHNGRLNINEIGVTLLTDFNYYTSKNDVQTMNIPTDNRVEYKEGILRYPMMEKGQMQRLRDSFIEMEIKALNDGNNTLLDIVAHETKWQPSNRI